MMNFRPGNFLSAVFLFYCRNIGRHPAKLRLINIFHKRFRRFIKVRAGNGAIMELVPKDYISGQIIFGRTYEPLSLLLTLELLADTSGCFLDVGANIGLYSSVVARSYPGKQIIAIEPQENNFAILNKNLKNNRAERAVTLNIAVGAGVKLIELECPVENNGGTYRVIVGGKQGLDCKKLYPMFDLCTVLNELLVKQVTLMKIDIEGYEMEAFKGMDWSVNKPRNIIMEYTDYVTRTGVQPDEVLDFLIEQGYKAYSVSKVPFLPGDELPEDNLWLSLD